MRPEVLGLLGAGAVGAVGVGTLGLRSLLRPALNLGIPVLRYRLVGPSTAGSPLNDARVAISRFDPQMRYLARRGFTSVTLSEAVANLHDPAFRAKNPIVFTFDGPYRAFLVHAWPVLRRYGFVSPTLFFPPNRLGQAQLTFRNGRPEPVLSLEELAALAREGVEVGLQAGSADDLPAEELANQFSAGRRALGALATGEIECLTLSFTTKRALKAAVKAGFTVIASIGDGVLSDAKEAMAVPRFPIMPDSTLLDIALVASRRYEGASW